MKKLNLAFFFFLLVMQISYAQDWANLNRYKEANAALEMPAADENRVVFMGNSITEGWNSLYPNFFSNPSYINRGISGQTTPQMLLRFRADVLALKPVAVVILAGINDIAGNTGPSTIEMIMDNIMSMAEVAKANGIKVVLCSVLPAADFPWRPGLEPAGKVIKLNKMIESYAEQNEMTYLDYFSNMVDDKNGLQEKYTSDGVHPNKAGYEVMAPLTEIAIGETIKGK